MPSEFGCFPLDTKQAINTCTKEIALPFFLSFPITTIYGNFESTSVFFYFVPNNILYSPHFSVAPSVHPFANVTFAIRFNIVATVSVFIVQYISVGQCKMCYRKKKQTIVPPEPTPTSSQKTLTLLGRNSVSPRHQNHSPQGVCPISVISG